MLTKSSETIDQNAKNFLTDSEMKKFLAAARQSRRGVRNFCLMLTAYRHGLKVSELVDVRLKDLDLETGRLFVRRLKGSRPPISRLKATNYAPSERGSENAKITRTPVQIICSSANAVR